MGAIVGLAAAACTPATTAEEISLAEELAPIAADANAAVASFERTLAQRYDDRSQLYGRIVDLRLPTSFAILIDKAQRVEPPPGAEAELDRYITFLGDMLIASEHLDGAIAAADPTATAVAAVELDAAVGALAAVLPAGSCPTLTPRSGRDLCDPGDQEGYEATLGFELRRFAASFRAPFRVPAALGEVVRGRVLATLQADAALVLENTADRLGDIDPGNTYAELHQIILGYFRAARAAWTAFEADSATAALLAAQHISLLEAMPDSKITAVTDIWFAPPAPEDPVE